MTVEVLADISEDLTLASGVGHHDDTLGFAEKCFENAELLHGPGSDLYSLPLLTQLSLIHI